MKGTGRLKTGKKTAGAIPPEEALLALKRQWGSIVGGHQNVRTKSKWILEPTPREMAVMWSRANRVPG